MEYRVIQTFVQRPYHGNLFELVESAKKLKEIVLEAGAESVKILRIDSGVHANCVGFEVTYRNGTEFGKIWYGGIDENERWRAYFAELWEAEEISEIVDHQVAWEVV
jgi:hypothetical protein